MIIEQHGIHMDGIIFMFIFMFVFWDTFYIIDGNLNWMTGRFDRFQIWTNKQRNKQIKHTPFWSERMETGKIFWS